MSSVTGRHLLRLLLLLLTGAFLYILYLLLIWNPALYFQQSEPDTFLYANEMAQYQILLRRAAMLKDKYATLSHGSTMSDKSMTDTVVAINKKIVDNGNSFGSTLPTNQSNDLILGMAQDTDPKNLAVFCRSLRRHNENVRVVIFVNEPIPNRHRMIAQESLVELRSFRLAERPTFMQSYHPSTLRWTLFADYLETMNTAHGIIFDRIWLIDVRDSYFQSDPFEFVDRKYSVFHVFNGVESFPIKKCGWNGGWIKDCFGERVLNSIGSNRIICSGVSVGTGDIVVDYVTIMSNVVKGMHRLPLVDPGSQVSQLPILESILRESKFPQCERNGVDQGVHNVIIHKNVLAEISSKRGLTSFQQHNWGQKDGPVANMQAHVANVRDNIVYNSLNKKVAVVHQYDRYPELQKFLFGEFVSWVNTNNFVEEWKYEANCQEFEYRKDSDLFKGICDLKMRGGATSAASCCKFCKDAPGCRAFTYLSGQCFLKKCSSPINRRSSMKGAVSAFLKVM